MKARKNKRSANKLGKPGSRLKAGLPPGSLVHIGKVKTDKTTIDLLEFDQNKLTKKNNIQLKEAINHLNTPPQTSWIKIVGLQDIALIESIGKQFDLDTLLLEDILNTGQRPKVVIADDFIFFNNENTGN